MSKDTRVKAELDAAEAGELRALTIASQTNGAGLDKAIARQELDERCAQLFTEGVTLRLMAEALDVKESSIHTRVVRIRRQKLDAVVEAATAIAVEAAEVEEVAEVEAPAETSKQRKARLARERRAAAKLRLAGE